DIAATTENVQAFGVAQMLHNLIRKGLLSRPGITVSELIAHIIEEDARSASGKPVLNRHRTLAALRARKLIAKGVSYLACKPAGTTPSAHAVCAIIEEVTGIPFREIASHSRVQEIVRARFLAAWLVR